MSKIQISALLTEQEYHELEQLANKLKLSKSQTIGTAITNYMTIKRLKEQNTRETETHVRNYADSQD